MALLSLSRSSTTVHTGHERYFISLVVHFVRISCITDNEKKSNFVKTYNGVVAEVLLTHIVFMFWYEVLFEHTVQTYLRITILPEEEQ